MFHWRCCPDIVSILQGPLINQKAKPKTTIAAKPVSKRNTENFKHRNDAQIAELVDEWNKYTHARARDFFPTQDGLESVLRQIALGVNETDDPILAEKGCVYWYGEVIKEGQQAAIRMVKPGEEDETVTFVNRVLAFIFATDDSFEQLMKLPKEPFKMACGDQLCCSLSHISLDISNADE
eukprot:GEMP01072093.1.p1 GENE.GEMP01072093.1~~GEMP01072093.1.p1  ORF type:complete len:180 (+),score=23.93 GEMP01072093.1:158-697(+)